MFGVIVGLKLIFDFEELGIELKILFILFKGKLFEIIFVLVMLLLNVIGMIW